jgi:hypothetical protein
MLRREGLASAAGSSRATRRTGRLALVVIAMRRCGADEDLAAHRRIKQSLMESLRSLEFFDKTNRSRELSTRSSVMRTLADPEGVHLCIALLSKQFVTDVSRTLPIDQATCTSSTLRSASKRAIQMCSRTMTTWRAAQAWTLPHPNRELERK